MNKNIKKLAKALNISENEVIACWKNHLKFEEEYEINLTGQIICLVED